MGLDGTPAGRPMILNGQMTFVSTSSTGGHDLVQSKLGDCIWDNEETSSRVVVF